MAERGWTAIYKVECHSEIARSGLAALAYAGPLHIGTAKTETASASPELLALTLTTGTRHAVHDYIIEYIVKEISARLGSKLSAEWGLTALRNGLVLRGKDASNQIVGPVFAVYEMTEARNPADPEVALATLVRNIEGAAEEVNSIFLSSCLHDISCSFWISNIDCRDGVCLVLVAIG